MSRPWRSTSTARRSRFSSTAPSTSLPTFCRPSRCSSGFARSASQAPSMAVAREAVALAQSCFRRATTARAEACAMPLSTRGSRPGMNRTTPCPGKIIIHTSPLPCVCVRQLDASVRGRLVHGDDGRGHRLCPWPIASNPGALDSHARLAVWLLHPWDCRGSLRALPLVAVDWRGRAAGAPRRQLVPLHWVPSNHRRSAVALRRHVQTRGLREQCSWRGVCGIWRRWLPEY